MKVILLSSVPGVGKVNDIVEVKDGYAMNNLIPRGLARAASEKNIAEVRRMAEKNRAADDARKKAVTEVLAALDGETITVEASANEKGRLFSALTANRLSEEIQNQKGKEIESEHIKVEDVIKEVGEHKILLALDDSKATLTVNVVPVK
jgi:large subunit ribosomal protein L9